MAKQDKSEKPSPQRIEKARREGNFITSRDFAGAFQFGAFVMVLSAWSGGWFQNMKQVIHLLLEQAFRAELGTPEVYNMTHLIAQRLLWPVAIGGGVVAAASFSAHLAVTRFGFSLKRLTPDIKRFNPADRLRSITREGLPGVAQALLMLIVFALVLYGLARDNVALFFFLPLTRPERGIVSVQEAVMTLLWRAVMLFGVFGVFDLFRQIRRYNQEMKMTKQELRDEHKESEGSPEAKMRIRRIQREMRRKRMMHEVATATAVIVNPTHFAVALRYIPGEMAAPVVVAKGKNYLALRIRQRAIEAQVPLVENPPLAQALYKVAEAGKEIPPHLYRAVAEILAYIYRLMQR